MHHIRRASIRKIKSNRSPTQEHTFYRYVPQLNILKRADLMITLAGANSIKEAITLGVPMLCYPFHSDQFGNAARVVYHRLGLRGNICTDSLSTIKSNIERIIGDKSFKENVGRFQEFFKPSNTENNLLPIINLVKKNE